MKFRLTWQTRRPEDILEYDVDESRILYEFLEEKGREEKVEFVGCHTFLIFSPLHKRAQKITDLHIPIKDLGLHDGDIFHVNVIHRCFN
jgi:hypothetical protein